MHGAHGVGDGALHPLAGLPHRLHGRLQVADVVEGVEAAEHVDAGLGGQADELPDHVVGVVAVAHDVLAPHEHLQAGVGHGRLEHPHPLPGVFVEEAHHGVDGGPAPHLQRPVSGSVELVGDGEHVDGAQTRGQQRLVGVAQHDVGYVDRVLSLGVILVLFHLRFSCPYRGMLPCFLAGRPSRLVAQASRAAIRRGRVSIGSMTSSM